MSNIIYFSTSDYSKYTLEKEHEEILGENTNIIKGEITDLKHILNLKDIQLDVETTMTHFITERKITVVQLGDYNGDTQYIFDIPRLTTVEFKCLLIILNFKSIKFYIHNAAFEYAIIKKEWGIDINNIEDTFILSKLLNNGQTLPTGYNGLAGIVYREFSVVLDKGAQTSFNGEELTYTQLIYAVLDVVFLTSIYERYILDIKYWKMYALYKLECNTVRAVQDMHVNGILFDMDYHKKHTIKDFTEKYNTAKQDMINNIFKDEKAVEFMKNNKMIQSEDEYLFKWTSPKIKKQILKLIVPKLDTSNKTTIKKLLKNDDDLSFKQRLFLTSFIDGEYSKLETKLISEYHDELVKLNLFVPKNTFLLNFDSPIQRLDLFKFWYPSLKDTNAKTLGRMNKPIIIAYKRYIKAAKMLSSFGEKMKEHIENDGRIHPSFTQLVSTGRMSSSKPNGQNQPSTSEYRNAYYAREGWSFVGADYSSQEILVATQASNEPGFWYAIKHGYDLHSYSAYQIYGKKWLEAGGEKFPIGKPKTKEANSLRKASKSLSFSLFYGSSALSLAENLDIPHKEAILLMEKYYKTFPKLAEYFQKQNTFGKKHKYSRGLPPFNRVRFYDEPRNAGEMNSIGRKSQNAGIQGTSADITKLAMTYIKQYIEKKNLSNKVKLTLQVHDEIICEVHDSIVEKWAKIQSKLMEKAADIIIPGGWLKAEAEIMKRWNK